jgi:hypothetical protein
MSPCRPTSAAMRPFASRTSACRWPRRPTSPVAGTQRPSLRIGAIPNWLICARRSPVARARRAANIRRSGFTMTSGVRPARSRAVICVGLCWLVSAWSGGCFVLLDDGRGDAPAVADRDALVFRPRPGDERGCQRLPDHSRAVDRPMPGRVGENREQHVRRSGYPPGHRHWLEVPCSHRRAFLAGSSASADTGQRPPVVRTGDDVQAIAYLAHSAWHPKLTCRSPRPLRAAVPLGLPRRRRTHTRANDLYRLRTRGQPDAAANTESAIQDHNEIPSDYGS